MRHESMNSLPQVLEWPRYDFRRKNIYVVSFIIIIIIVELILLLYFLLFVF
jgi:hypothetical protein